MNKLYNCQTIIQLNKIKIYNMGPKSWHVAQELCHVSAICHAIENV